MIGMEMGEKMAATKDMTTGAPAKLLFGFSLPLMLGNVFQQFYTIVDTIIVGQGVGMQALASIGAADWLILSLFISAEEVQAEQVLQIAHHYLMIMSTFLIILYALHTYRSALQGMGDTVIPMVSGMVEFGMRVSAAIFLPRFIGQEGIFYAEILAWSGACVLLVTVYYKRIAFFKT